MLGLRREPLHAVHDHLRSAGEEPVGLRVVGRPQDLVRADIVGQRLDAALDRLERDPAIALEEFARPRRQTGIVEALIVEMPVHAVEPRRDPAAARFEEGDADLRVLFADPAPNHAHAGEHHLHRVRDDVAGAAALEAVDADRRHAARRTLVEADREIEILGRRPERLVIGMMDHLVVVGVGPNEAAAEAQFLFGKAYLGDREVDRLQWQHRDAEQAIGIGLAIIGEPAVVGAARRSGELGVLNRAGEQAEAWIEEGGVDAVGIHVGDALVRIKPARLSVLILHRVVDDTLPRPDRANPPDAALAVADRVLFDDEPLLAVLALDDPRRAVAKFRIDVFVPEIQRLEDVPIGIDDVVSATHNPAPFGQMANPKTKRSFGLLGRYAAGRLLSSPTNVIRGAAA